MKEYYLKDWWKYWLSGFGIGFMVASFIASFAIHHFHALP